MESGIVDIGPIRKLGECGQAQINADLFIRGRQRLRGAFDAEHSIPLSGLAFDANGFDIPFDWPMQFQFDLADALYSQLAIVEHFAAGSISGEGDAVISTDRSESGISWRLTSLYAHEECLESLIQSPQYVLRALSINQ